MSDCSTSVMTLDDAINHLDYLIASGSLDSWCRCEHEQLCMWLVELKDSKQRYERLAQVALDMLRYARIRLDEHWTKEDAKACKAYEDELRALGVIVDDM